MHPDQEVLEAGIVSFRALKKGFLPASLKEGKKANSLLDAAILKAFEVELKELLKEIFNPTIPFEHKNRTEPCRFCDPEKFR